MTDRQSRSADSAVKAESPDPGPCRDVLLIATPDASRARYALDAMDKALAAAGCDSIYVTFLFGSGGEHSVWVARRDGGPVPGSAAWEAADRSW